LVSLNVTDRDWHLQCCQGAKILAAKLKKGRKKSWWGWESKGPNFFASGRIFWLILEKILKISWQHWAFTAIGMYRVISLS
jgi:hypothetical protein